MASTLSLARTKEKNVSFVTMPVTSLYAPLKTRTACVELLNYCFTHMQTYVSLISQLKFT